MIEISPYYWSGTCSGACEPFCAPDGTTPGPTTSLWSGSINDIPCNIDNLGVFLEAIPCSCCVE